MRKLYLFFSLLTILALSSCDEYVSNIENPVAVANDNLLNEQDIPFLTKGIQFRFAQTATNILMCAEGLSDTYYFERDVPNATFPQYDEIDKATILRDNNSVRGFFNALGEFRFYADDMIAKVAKLTTLTDAVKKTANFTGYFYGGLARYYYATYIGLRENEGGGTINKSPFIPSAQMYALAIEKFKEALQYGTAAEQRIVNTHLARTYLFMGDYPNAATYAKVGMQSGDASFNALYNLVNANQFYIFAGRFRAQFIMDARFKAYVDADPKEASRVVIEPVKGNSGVFYSRQAKMLKEDDPVVCATWQENTLMLAELALRGQSTGDALTLINQVRASHQINPLTAASLDVIYTERDKELNCLGLRLPDQRRFNRWHNTPGAWRYFPITTDEINANLNLPRL